MSFCIFLVRSSVFNLVSAIFFFFSAFVMPYTFSMGDRFMETMWKSKHWPKCIIVLFIFIPTAQVPLYFRLHMVLAFCLKIFLLVHHVTILIPDCMNAEPINIFHGSYDTDTPPIRLSYHHGNHYNSLVDPRRLAIGAGLGFSSLRGVSGWYSFGLVLFQGAILIPE